MQQHLYLTGEERPGAVRIFPAHQKTLFTHRQLLILTHLPETALRHSQVRLSHT